MALTSMEAPPKVAKRQDPEGKAPGIDPEGPTLKVSGVGIGLFGVVSAAIGGAVCPICVVAAPLLLGVGAVRTVQASRKRAKAQKV